MELNSEDDYQVIKKQSKQLSSGEEPLSPTTEKPFKTCQVPCTCVNLPDRCNRLQIVPCEPTLPFCFIASSPANMRKESLDYLIRQLEETEKPISDTE